MDNSRPVPTFTYAKSLTGLRGVAFLLVFIAHLTQFYRLPIINSGKEGLLLFFALSAFLLTRHTYDQVAAKPTIKTYANYFIRRFFRIYPMFFVALVVAYLAGIPAIPTVKDILLHLLQQEGNIHFWSIPVEFQYYLVIPVLVLIGTTILKNRPKVMMAVCLAVLLFYTPIYGKITTITSNGMPNQITVWAYLPVFLLGSAAAFLTLVANRIQDYLIHYKTLILIIVLALLVISFPFTYWDFMYEQTTHVFYGWLILFGTAFSLLIYLQVMTKTILTGILDSRVLVFLGNISFSAYLFHYLILYYLSLHYLWLNQWLSMVIVLGITIGLSTITYYTIERPFLKIRL